MSQIPRRTSEFQPSSSAKRPTRASRITQSAVRNSSVNRISTVASTNVRPSSSRTSATPLRTAATPARTPNRATSRDRITMMPMTAEKEKAPIDDREFMQAKSIQILEELSKNDSFKELVQKGLKSMTHKQFITILQYFLLPIIGEVPKDFPSTYVDFVYNLLIRLEYPYNINKSSLKTPNALHCLNSIILLIGWLMDFSTFEGEVIQYKITEECINEDLMKLFMNKTSEAFPLFNEEKDTDYIEKDIKDTYLEMRAGVGSDVISEISRLQFEINQLHKETKPLSLMKELNFKRETSEKLDQEISLHKGIIKDLNRKLTNMESELEVKKQFEYTSLKELQILQHQFTNQKLNIDQRHQLLIEINQLKSALASKKEALMEVSEAGIENEITLSNLISKKFLLIDRLNNLIYKLSSDLDIAGVGSKFDPQTYEIKSSKDEDMEQMLNNMYKGLSSLQEKYNNLNSFLKESLLKLDSEQNSFKSESEIRETKMQQLRTLFEQLSSDETSLDRELSALIHNTQINYHDHKEQVQSTEKEIKERTKGIEEIKKSVEEFNAKKTKFASHAVIECKNLYELRKKEVDVRRAFLTEQMAAISTYEENKKTLSESHQKLLDRIVKAKQNKENNQPLSEEI